MVMILSGYFFLDLQLFAMIDIVHSTLPHFGAQMPTFLRREAGKNRYTWVAMRATSCRKNRNQVSLCRSLAPELKRVEEL